MTRTHETLSAKLNEAGIINEFFRLNKRWVALRVFYRAPDRAPWFWVRHSSLGWSLGDVDVYRVPAWQDVLDVCISRALGGEPHGREVSSADLDGQSSWTREEFAAEERIWESVGWRQIDEPASTMICDAFEKRFGYPSDRFLAPEPSAAWDFSCLYDCDLCALERSSAQLNLAGLLSLRECLSENESLIALDWNHVSYELASRTVLETGDLEKWPITVFPEGDYHIFVARDFRLGIVSDPSGMVCAFGDQMPQAMALKLDETTLKTKII